MNITISYRYSREYRRHYLVEEGREILEFNTIHIYGLNAAHLSKDQRQRLVDLGVLETSYLNLDVGQWDYEGETSWRLNPMIQDPSNTPPQELLALLDEVLRRATEIRAGQEPFPSHEETMEATLRGMEHKPAIIEI
jgi:hypothetical protein